MAILNFIYAKLTFKKETTNPGDIEIKDELILHGMAWAAAYKIEYNTIGAFQTSDSNTPGYYIFRLTGNAHTLQEKYTFHSFDPPVLIPEGELVCPAKFMTPTRKTSYCYHELDESISVMEKLIQVVMPYIYLIQGNNTTNNLPSRFKGYAEMNPHLLSEHDH